MPITASPQPINRPSSSAAAIPRGSSVGWLGCSRVASVPGNPIVVRKAAVAVAAAATRIKSWLRMTFDTAATISGVSPGEMAAMRAALSSRQAASSSQSRKPPTVRCAMGPNASRSWLSMMSRVTSSVSYGTTTSVRNVASGMSASTHAAAARSASEPAAQPASWSPERNGVAFAITSTSPAKVCVVPEMVCR